MPVTRQFDFESLIAPRRRNHPLAAEFARFIIDESKHDYETLTDHPWNALIPDRANWAKCIADLDARIDSRR